MTNSVWIHGYSGKMGQEILALIKDNSVYSFIAGSDQLIYGLPSYAEKDANTSELSSALSANPPDIILDFSTVTGNSTLLSSIQVSTSFRSAVLIGTTGLSKGCLDQWKKTAKEKEFSLLFAPNTSLGITLTIKAALAVAGVLNNSNFDIENPETHHRNKVDSPSGTARLLASAITSNLDGLKTAENRQGKRQNGEIGVQAIRGGSVFGEHEIRFLGEHEELKISHRAFDRMLFAKGALTLAGWVLTQESGHYGLSDVDI